MKKGILFFTLIGFLFSCNDDDNSSEIELVGTWKLIEVLVGSGDGSGVFETVNSEKILEFQKDGIVTSNGRISAASVEANVSNRLRYSVTESVIFSDGFSSMKFEITDSFLIVDNLCTEPCQSKYAKVR